jgi:hypothetical protein
VIGRFNLPERWGRAPAVVLIGVFLLLLLGLGVAAFSERLYRTQSRQQAEVQAAMLAASVGTALVFED